MLFRSFDLKTDRHLLERVDERYRLAHSFQCACLLLADYMTEYHRQEVSAVVQEMFRDYRDGSVRGF